MVILIHRTTLMDVGFAQCGLFRLVPILRAVLRWSHTCMENSRRPNVAYKRNRHTVSAPNVMVWDKQDYMTCITSDWINGNLNSDLTHSGCARGMPNVIFQKDNARPRVTHRVLTFLDTQGI